MTFREKAKVVWKKHKVKIIIGSGSVIAGGALAYIIVSGKNKGSAIPISKISNGPDESKVPISVETLQNAYKAKGTRRKKVNVSGLEYDVIFTNLKNALGRDDVAGWCGDNIPVMMIDTEKAFWMTDNRVIRHELMHAFFNRSGLENYSCDEKLIDWLAYEFPSIVKACAELGCTE